jgi:Uma2 family endonuclease
MSTGALDTPPVEYPDSDGQPMAENTRQYEYIVTIKGGLDVLFAAAEVFVAGDLFWYPVEGHPEIRVAPDVLVAFGRPKGHRGSYKQWEEGDVAPQVVFEILSPSNRNVEMADKFDFYQFYGVEEYYLYDPDAGVLRGYLRQGDRLRRVPVMQGHVSPRLGVRFELADDELHLYGPASRRFASFLELATERDAAERQAEHERHQRLAAERSAAEERRRAEQLAALLRQHGIDLPG